MIDLNDRERKVDVSKLSDDQVDNLSVQLTEKIIKIVEKANQDANKILNIYGLETVVKVLKPVPIGTLKQSQE